MVICQQCISRERYILSSPNSFCVMLKEPFRPIFHLAVRLIEPLKVKILVEIGPVNLYGVLNVISSEAQRIRKINTPRNTEIDKLAGVVTDVGGFLLIFVQRHADRIGVLLQHTIRRQVGIGLFRLITPFKAALR